MKDLTTDFNKIFRITVEQYIDRKNAIENIGKTTLVPKSITKREIYCAYMATICSIIMILKINELCIYDVVIRPDCVLETPSQLFEEKLYPIMESYLTKEKGVKVIVSE